LREPLSIRAIDAITAGVKTAKANPKSEADPVPDDYVAWCVWNALRRAGLKIVEVDGQQGDSN
jgi:hypothetical protein